MKEFKQLIDVLERKGRSSASALINFSDDTSLETRLYHLIKNDENASERDIANKLYGEPEINGAYKMLKSRTKKKLYNQLLFLDADNDKIVSRLGAIELKCKRNLYFATVLKTLGEYKLSELQIKKALELAEEAHLIKCKIDALELLRIIIAERSFNRKLYNDCVSKIEEAKKIYDLESESNKRYYDIRFNLKLGVEANNKFIKKLSDYITEVEGYWVESGSSLIFQQYHGLKIISYEYNGDAESLVHYLKDMFARYEDGKIHPLYFPVIFNRYLLVFGYLRAKQFNEGLNEAEQLKQNIQEGTRNWFAHMENYFLLAVHSKAYEKAETLIEEVLNNKYLKETTAFSQERWQLFYQFLNYITGFTSPAYPDNKLKYVPQDKKGYNVWRLILDFILALQAKEPELIEREIERLRKFSSKYLTAKEDTRTKTFMKLLQVAGRDISDSKLVKRKGTYLFNKLQQTPAAGIAFAETEIIPYEHLWELVLQKMDGDK